jgi:predicted nuclease of predicted toxin-antitoxin system
MRFLADMGISQSTVKWLRKKGYDATHLREEGLHELSDVEIIRKARKEDRTIITCDLDFGYIMAISGDIAPSLIIFRLDDETPHNINHKLALILDESCNALENGAIISVGETRYRVRLLPISK